MKKDKQQTSGTLIALNGSRPSGPSGISVDTHIMMSNGKPTEENFYAYHANEKGFLGKLWDMIRKSGRS